MIRAVIFDMYETLITHYNSPLYFGAQIAEDAGMSVDNFLREWRPATHDRFIGKVTLEELLEKIFKENQCYSEELVKKVVEKRIATNEDCFKHLHPEIIPMLSRLKDKGMLIGLISNCFPEEEVGIRKSELFKFFDAAMFSSDQGVVKPDAEIYRRCMKALSVNADECLYVGDGGSNELEAARDIGMKAVQAAWYLKEGTFQPAGRKPEFEQVERPMELMEFIDCNGK